MFGSAGPLHCVSFILFNLFLLNIAPWYCASGDDDESINTGSGVITSLMLSCEAVVIPQFSSQFWDAYVTTPTSLYCLTEGNELPGGAPPGAPWLGREKRFGEDSSARQDHRLRPGQAPERRWERVPRRWRKGWLECAGVRKTEMTAS